MASPQSVVTSAAQNASGPSQASAGVAAQSTQNSHRCVSCGKLHSLAHYESRPKPRGDLSRAERCILCRLENEITRDRKRGVPPIAAASRIKKETNKWCSILVERGRTTAAEKQYGEPYQSVPAVNAMSLTKEVMSWLKKNKRLRRWKRSAQAEVSCKQYAVIGAMKCLCDLQHPPSPDPESDVTRTASRSPSAGDDGRLSIASSSSAGS